jgi:hypothetical protein
MKPRVRAGVVVTAVSVAVSFLTVCVPAASATAVAPATGSGGAGSAVWAYGGLSSFSGVNSAGAFPYHTSVTVGAAVVLNETSPSPGVYDVNVSRTMGVILSAMFCQPSCSHPTLVGEVAYHAWETVDAQLVLTSSASVTVQGSPTPALGLVSSNLSVDAGRTRSSTVSSDGALVREVNLSVVVSANAQTEFSPALGLLPIPLQSGEVWNSTSNFSESGSGNWSISESSLRLPSVSLPGQLDLNRTGSVNLSGAYSGSIKLAGARYDQFALTLQGPFSLREGFLLVPSTSDLFGATAPGWLVSALEANATTNASVSQATVDVSGSGQSGGHLGFEGSSSVWSSATPNPAASDVVVGSGGGETPAAVAPATSSNATTVQSSPEPVPEALADQRCLAAGFGCPASPTLRGPLGGVLVIGAVIGVVMAAVVLVAERRRLPPAVYPNASLYPPSSAVGSAGAGTPSRPTRPAPPADEDPLGHLW